MNWMKIKDIAWFAFIFVLAITLIEHQSDTWLVDIAGDLFGALGLMALAVERVLRDEI